MIQNYLKGFPMLLCLISILAVNGNISFGQGSQPEPMNHSADLMIKITSPSNGESISDPASVSGTILGEIPNDHYVWLLTAPKLSPGLYWPQGNDHITPIQGLWSWVAYLGGNSGNKVDLLVALVDKGTNQDFINYTNQCAAARNYPGIKFPDSAKIIDKITVVKK
jgi:hypothetical protein